MESGELMSMDSINYPDSLVFYTAGGRQVFGGGGIMPDYFVPIDTTGTSDYYAKLIRKGVLYNFILTYLDTHRKDLESQYPDVISFKENFEVSSDFEEELVAFAETKKIEPNEDQLNTSREILHIQIKALIARNLWDSSAYFQIWNEMNPTYQQALKVIADKKTFKKQGIAQF
jgi:carboxyl-terminal processing protease